MRLANDVTMLFADETFRRLGHDEADDVGNVRQMAELERKRVCVEGHRWDN
jgi:hypothetical protein